MNLVPWTKRNRLANDDFFAPLPSVFRNFFDENFDLQPFDRPMGFNPTLDIAEDENSYKVTVELPGVDPKDVDISYDNGVLTLQGEKKEETEKKEKNYHRVERRYGSFSRSVRFPAQVEPDKVKANYKNGLLHIELPKSEVHKPKKIAVKMA